MPLERRLLKLQEWIPKPVQLDPDELAELQGVGGKLIVQPQGSGTYEVTPASVVGSVTTRRLSIIIQPKFKIDRLFYMLAYVYRLDLLRESAELGAIPDLTEGFIRLYLDMLRRRLRRGLLMGYRTEEESLQTVRGRIRIAEQLRRRFGMPIPIEVAYDDYTVDTAENRLIKAALRRLERLQLESPALRSRIAEALVAMDLVADQRFSARSLPSFRYTRLTEPYRPVLELSALIVRSLALELEEGTHVISALLFDMNKLFEDFIFQSLKRRLSGFLGAADAWKQGHTVSLDEQRALRPEPDLAWWRGTRCLFVGDAKYKLTEVGKLSDLYQLLAYCVATNLPSGLLIYAEQPTGPAAHKIVHGGPVLNVTGVDVESPIPAIEARLDEIAARIRQAAGDAWRAGGDLTWGQAA